MTEGYVMGKSKIVLVTGGARSGKSTFAENLAGSLSDDVAYIATAVPFDDGMIDRIKKHQASRPSHWITYEKSVKVYEVIKQIDEAHNVALLDCITIMVNNIMFEDPNLDWDGITHDEIDVIEEKIQNEVERLIEEVRRSGLTIIVVTNELGMGIVPENRLARIYRDIAGRVNQLLGSKADEVYFTVSGIPMQIKGA